VPDDEDDRAAALAEEVARLRALGHTTIGIYAKTNNDAAGLSAALTNLAATRSRRLVADTWSVLHACEPRARSASEPLWGRIPLGGDGQ
jgi:hypothetical protein